MISGFSTGSVNNDYQHSRVKYSSNLPVPFNIPNVLHNLLFEDVGLEFNAKQNDLKETLIFSSKALTKMEERYAKSEAEVRTKILQEPDNKNYVKELEEIQLDRLEAHAHFKDLVIVMSDLLVREQYTKLLAFSGIPA